MAAAGGAGGDEAKVSMEGEAAREGGVSREGLTEGDVSREGGVDGERTPPVSAAA